MIRSAALLNAAIIRKPDNVQEAKDYLKVLCSDVLKKAGANKLEADLSKIADKVKKLVGNMRKTVKEKLELLGNTTGGKSKNAKISIKSLQEHISSDYTKIMADLSKDCVDVMGNPPCKFSLIGMGSLARKEITPYSDFEHIIVLEKNQKKKIRNKKKSEEKPDYKEYFRWLSVIFQVVVINLQETIIPSLDIENLKFFYNKITTRCICFDGMMPRACKFHLGQQLLSGENKEKTELIKSADEMVKYLSSSGDIKSGYHLKDIITKICFVYGDKNVFEDFQQKSITYWTSKIKKKAKKKLKIFLLEIWITLQHDQTF